MGRRFQREFLPLLPVLSKVLAVMVTDLSRDTEAEGGTRVSLVCELAVSAQSQGHARAAGKTCPHTAPFEQWRPGVTSPSSSGLSTLGRAGSSGVSEAQTCCSPAVLPKPLLAFQLLLVSKTAQKKLSDYAKQQILVTPPLPITR